MLGKAVPASGNMQQLAAHAAQSGARVRQYATNSDTCFSERRPRLSSWTSPGRLQGMGVLAKVWPDTYKEWLRRVRSGLREFGPSNFPPVPLTRYP